MATTTDFLSLDLSKQNLMPPVQAKQYDTDSRFITVQLMNKGVNYSVESGNSVYINIRRADGEKDSFSGTRNNDGTVTVPIPSWCLELAGLSYASISIVNGDVRLTTLSFQIEVQKAETDEEITPEE